MGDTVISLGLWVIVIFAILWALAFYLDSRPKPKHRRKKGRHRG